MTKTLKISQVIKRNQVRGFSKLYHKVFSKQIKNMEKYWNNKNPKAASINKKRVLLKAIYRFKRLQQT